MDLKNNILRRLGISSPTKLDAEAVTKGFTKGWNDTILAQNNDRYISFTVTKAGNVDIMLDKPTHEDIVSILKTLQEVISYE